MPKRFWTIMLLILIFLFPLLFFWGRSTRDDVARIDASAVYQSLKDGKIAEVKVKDKAIISGVYRTEAGLKKFETYLSLDLYPALKQLLAEQNVRIADEPEKLGGGFFSFLIPLLPILIFGALIFLMMRSAAGGQGFQFMKSRAKMFNPERITATFEDVAGVEEAKQELQEVVDFLEDSARFVALGARIPRGVILVGPSGTGKTLLAKAVAGEAGVPFFSISGSEFVELFVGVGASRVRDLFDQAKKNAPCIIFIDEIDAVGRHRGAGLGHSHDEREQTLNQILVEMDGFDQRTNIIILAATNRPDILDPALLRPGRFDRQVAVDRPDVKGRQMILRVHARGKPLAPDVNLEIVAKETPGFTGADLENVLNEAAILAARRRREEISMKDVDDAVDKVIAGPERKSRVIIPKEKEITAYHETGHALAAASLPDAEKVYKISCIPRGMIGGYTKILPKEDRRIFTKNQLKAELTTLLAGMAAEELAFGKDSITTGASNDLERATAIAKKMVTEYGMSEKLGPRTFGKKEDIVFLGKEFTQEFDYSEKVAEMIDDEIDWFVKEAYLKAKRILEEKKNKLEAIVLKLKSQETIEGKELEGLLTQ